MATAARQPFAPLDGPRLHSLTSLKNRQNALPSSSGKRKAAHLDLDDSENRDPLLFAKRSKGVTADAQPAKDALKPTLTFALNAATLLSRNSGHAAKKAAPNTRRGPPVRSPLAKSSSSSSSSSSSCARPSVPPAPAGRSPTIPGGRSGILSSGRRRGLGPYTRIDPPSMRLASSAPFSLDAALKGTIPSYGSRPAPKAPPPKRASASPKRSKPQSEFRASWFFDIHEDTPEQEMTNLLQHSTCVLDISSDEESERRASRDKAEGRDKENIPPAEHHHHHHHHNNNISRRRSSASPISADPDDMVVEAQRVALGEIKASEFYPEGCDETSVILIPEDEDAATVVGDEVPVEEEEEEEEEEDEDEDEEDENEEESELEFCQDIDELMSRDAGNAKAAVLQPIEGTGESFELWESDSTKDDEDTL